LFALAAAVARPLGAQVTPTEITAGLHYGFDFTEGYVDDERVGVQAYVGIVDILGIAGTLSHIPDFYDIDGVFSGSAWESFLTVRVRPWGPGTAVAFGYGAALARTSVRDLRSDDTALEVDRTDVGVIALEIPLERLRPFGELYLLNLLNRRGQVVGNAHFGLSLRLL
jgi:hypothetical protein